MKSPDRNRGVAESEPGADNASKSPESREKRREAIREAQEAGVKKVKEKFGPDGAQEELAYHGEAHTRSVIERAANIVKALDGTDDEIELACLAAAWHDVIQDASDTPEAGNRIRQLTPTNQKNPETGNEYHSYQALVEHLERESKIILKPEGARQLKEAILATAPDFTGFGPIQYEGVVDENGKEVKPVVPDSVGPKIDQPFLIEYLEQHTDNPSKIVIAVALADLGTVGIETGEKVLKDGDAEYRETRSALKAIYDSYPEEQKEAAQQRINELLMDASGNQVGDQEVLARINTDEQAVVLKSMEKWLEGQVGFAEYQRERFYKILQKLPEKYGNKLAGVCNQFEANINGLRRRAQQQQGKKFREVAQEMGYKPEDLPQATA